MTGSRTRAHGRLAVGVLLVVGLAACGSSSGSSAKETSTSSEVPGQSPRPTTPLPSVQVLHESGTGDATTKTFEVAAKWGVAWNYDCSESGGSGFTLTVLEDGQRGADAPVSSTGTSGSGVQHFTSGPGSKALQIASACTWTVTVGNES